MNGTVARVNGVDAASIAADDRGLAYGDGLFETVRVIDGTAPLWARHVQRLRDGARRLGIPMPSDAALADDLAALFADRGEGVLKLILTRGPGARGYAAPPHVAATRIAQRLPAPPAVSADYREGIAVRWCTLRLGMQPALAGLKHLNRLEQVLARAEWDDPAVAEGLLCDAAGRVICATGGNVFAGIGGTLVTPPVTACGVAGVLRDLVIESGAAPVSVRDMLPEELERADEVFVTNAVRGVRPVRALGARRWTPGPIARALQARCAALGLPPSGIAA